MSPLPEDKTDLGRKFPESVFTKVIRVSCESGSDPCAREFDESAIAQSAMKIRYLPTYRRVTDLHNFYSFVCSRTFVGGHRNLEG